MLLDLRDGYASLWIRDEDFVKKVSQAHRYQLVVSWLTFCHILIHLNRALCLEGCLSTDDLDHQHPEAPDVVLDAVSRPQQDLW